MCLSVCLHAREFNGLGGQKASDPMELDLWNAVRHPGGARNL